MAISLTKPDLHFRQLDFLPKLLIVLLVVLVAWQLAKLTWQFLDIWQSPDTVDVIEFDNKVARQEASLFNWKSLPLFGQADVKSATGKKEVKQEKKVITGALRNLNVILLGIVASSDPQHSYVVIKDKSETKVLRQGEEIRDGINIKLIEAKSFTATDGVNDKQFELEMLAKGNSPSTKRSSRVTAPTEDGGLPPVNFRVTNPQVREKIAEYRETLNENPLELMGQIKAQPVPRNGETYGYRVYPGRDRTLLSGVGLRPGDILLSVNDNSLSDISQLETVIESLSQSNTIQLKIERGGKVRDINVVLEN